MVFDNQRQVQGSKVNLQIGILNTGVVLQSSYGWAS